MLQPIVLIILFAGLSQALHFRGGSLSYEPVSDLGNGEVVVSIEKRFAWRRDSNNAFCDANTIKNMVDVGDTGYIQCKIGCSPLYAVDTVLMNVYTKCTAFSVAENWSYGSKKEQIRLPVGKDIQINFNGSAWIPLVAAGVGSANPNDKLAWELRLKLDTTIRSDTGRMNSAPVTLMPPVVELRKGFKHVIKIPTSDRDGDTVKCRWASLSKMECADVCSSLPTSVLNEDTCELNYEALTAGWYAVTIQLEDYVSSTMAGPLSSAPVQFLVYVVDSKSTCIINPKLEDLAFSPCYAVQVGSKFHQTLTATENCAGEKINEIQVLAPAGFTTSGLKKAGTQWSLDMDWTPVASQKGSHIICATAKSSSLLSSNLTCFNLIVGIDRPKPVKVDLMTQPLESNLNNAKFEFTFDSNVMNPSASSLISVFEKSSGAEVLTVDTSKASAKDTKLTLELKLDSLAPGDYYGILDDGAMIAEDYCHLPSLKETSPTFWTFNIPEPTTTTMTTTTTTTSTTTTTTAEPISNCTTREPENHGPLCNFYSFLLLILVEWALFIIIQSILFTLLLLAFKKINELERNY